MTSSLPPLPAGTGSRVYRNPTYEKFRRDILDMVVGVVDALDTTEQLEELTRTLAATIASLRATAATAGDAIASGNTIHASLQAQIDALAARTMTVRAGSQKITAVLALGGTMDITVPFNDAFPDTNYTWAPIPGAALIGAATMTEKNKTKTGVTLTIKAAAALAAGSAVEIVAVRYA